MWVEKDAITTLANLCDGDARASLNGLQMAVQSRVISAKFAAATQSDGDMNQNNIVIINTDHVKEGLQRSHVLYDRTGLCFFLSRGFILSLRVLRFSGQKLHPLAVSGSKGRGFESKWSANAIYMLIGFIKEVLMYIGQSYIP